MFDDLLDDVAVDEDALAIDQDPAPAAAPAAAAAAAAPRPRRGGVTHHSELSKTRIKLSWARRQRAQSAAVASRLSSGNFDTFSEHVSAVTFGKKSPECRKVLMLANGGHCSQLVARQGNRSDDHRTSKLYGCVSAATGQASGLAKFLSDDHASKVLSTVSSSTFDDASMWMKDPCTKAERLSNARCEGLKVADGKLWRRGKNICLPVYNATESILSRRVPVVQPDSEQQLDHVLRAAVVHSPAQVLPEANTGTIANRRRRWLAAGVQGAGSKVDLESCLSSVSSSAWHTVVATKDNLALNDCVLGLDEQVIRDRMRSGLDDNSTSVTLLTVSCSGHSAVLSTKEVSTRLDGLPSKLVRMGHLHESGRTVALFVQYLDEAVVDNFVFEPVPAMPEESHVWRTNALNVLRNSRPCLDLTPEDELFIVSVDNGNWDDDQWKHLCVGPSCICKGSRHFALQLMKRAARLSVGHMDPTPLEYRRKGVERFTAKVFRGRRQHDVYLKVHQRIWPHSQTRRSEAALAALAERNGDLSNDALRHKTIVRGGKTVDFMEQDVGGQTLERALILNIGVQHFLNKCFESDALVTKYTDLLQQVPNNASVADDGVAAAQSAILNARNACIKSNLHILSGDAARALLAEYSGFFDFQSPSWDGWRTNDDQRFAVCLDMVVVMQDAFYRLLHKLDVPKFNIFDACSLDLGTDVSTVDMEAVMSIAKDLRQRDLQCDECVDPVFTIPWVARLLDYGSTTARQAWLSLGDILSLLRVCSTLVEKKHLVGQEAKPRKRGVCIAADEVGGFVFRKLVERAAELARAAAMADCLGEHVREFQTSLTDLLFQGHGDRRSEVASAAAEGQTNALGKRSRNILKFDAKMKRQRIRGYDVFIRSNFHSGLAGESNFEKRKSLDVQWKSLPDAEKHAYNAIAESEDDEDAAHENDNFVQFLAKQKRLGEGGKKRKSARYLNARLRAAQRTIQDLINNSVFDSGTALHDFDKGIKPSLIKSSCSRQEIVSTYKELFDYDHKPVPNPADISHFKPCCVKHGGYCKGDALVDRAGMMTSNLHVVCGPWKDEFPIILEFSVGAWDGFVMLGRLIGKGELGIISRCEFLPKGPDRPWDCCDIQFGELDGKAMHLPVTSYEYFVGMLSGAAVLSECDPGDFEQVTLRRWNFVREASVAKFRARLVDVHTELSLQCMELAGKGSSTTNLEDMLPFGLGRPEKNIRRRPGPSPDDLDAAAADLADESAHEVAPADVPSCNDDAVLSNHDDDDAADEAAEDVQSQSDDHGLDDEPWNSTGLKDKGFAPKGRP